MTGMLCHVLRMTIGRTIAGAVDEADGRIAITFTDGSLLRIGQYQDHDDGLNFTIEVINPATESA